MNEKRENNQKQIVFSLAFIQINYLASKVIPATGFLISANRYFIRLISNSCLYDHTSSTYPHQNHRGQFEDPLGGSFLPAPVHSF